MLAALGGAVSGGTALVGGRVRWAEWISCLGRWDCSDLSGLAALGTWLRWACWWAGLRWAKQIGCFGEPGLPGSAPSSCVPEVERCFNPAHSAGPLWPFFVHSGSELGVVPPCSHEKGPQCGGQGPTKGRPERMHVGAFRPTAGLGRAGPLLPRARCSCAGPRDRPTPTRSPRGPSAFFPLRSCVFLHPHLSVRLPPGYILV